MRIPRKITVCGLDYEVIHLKPGTPVPSCMGVDDEAYFDSQLGKMWIKRLNPTRDRDAFFHELQHMTLDASGAGRYIRKGREEDFVHTYTPALVCSLVSAKLLRG